MAINTLPEAASYLEVLGVPFVKTETRVSALTEGRSGTGHNFSTQLTIESTDQGLFCSCFGFGEDLSGVTAEEAIKEYSHRSNMVESSDGN